MTTDDRDEITIPGIRVARLHRNLNPAQASEHAIRAAAAGHPDGCVLAASGALIGYSGAKTGRSPNDKRIVEQEPSYEDVWWGDVNIGIDRAGFRRLRGQAVDALNRESELYVVDAFAGWDPAERIKVRTVCASPFQALFMYTMLVRPTAAELQDFGEPDFTIINAGHAAADNGAASSSDTALVLSFEDGEMIVLGTRYAGEMKKGVFTLMNYLMPGRGHLSMHCSATEALDGTHCSLLFGLSGTGKTTLSADPERRLIGDDEHVWTERGIFNIEGGCYAKTIGLDPKREPNIHGAIRFGAVLENVVYDEETRRVDYDDGSVTENTRAAYPIQHIGDAKIPCVGGHPHDILFLTCDAFGVLPPVAQLDAEQAMYHFISGYTAKVAGTEEGVREPKATFSACFGSPFLAWHPYRYAELLAERIERHGTRVWLVNTGWSGGPYGSGERMPLRVTRALVTAINSGALLDAPMTRDAVFGFAVPTSAPGLPDQILVPRETWSDPERYDRAARELAGLFAENFQHFADAVSPSVVEAGPAI